MKIKDIEKWQSDFDTDEENLRELKRLASLREINIFVDSNHIIKRLCIALLEEKGLDPWKTK